MQGLHLDGVSHAYGGKNVPNNVSLAIPAGAACVAFKRHDGGWFFDLRYFIPSTPVAPRPRKMAQKKWRPASDMSSREACEGRGTGSGSALS